MIDFSSYKQDVIDHIPQEYEDLALQAEILLQQKDPSAMVQSAKLAGSYAKGNPTEESDIDIEIEYDGNLSEEEASNLLAGKIFGDFGLYDCQAKKVKIEVQPVPEYTSRGTYRESSNSFPLRYMGTCVDIDEYGDNYGFDPTEFAQAEDRALDDDIDLEAGYFWELAVGIPGIPSEIKQKLVMNDDVWYAYDTDLNVSWAYNPDEDIHYIFTNTPKSSISVQESTTTRMKTSDPKFMKLFYKYWYGSGKLPSLKGYPKGLDLENRDIVYIAEDYVQIQAGGDWQEPVTFSFAVVNGRPEIVDQFYNLLTKNHTDEIRAYCKKVKEIKESTGIDAYRAGADKTPLRGEQVNIISTEIAPFDKQEFDHWDYEYDNPFTPNPRYDPSGRLYTEALSLQEYVSYIKGHKNSKGEVAPWVIKSHETGKILSSHKSKAAAQEHLQQMQIYKEDKIQKEILREAINLNHAYPTIPTANDEPGDWRELLFSLEDDTVYSITMVIDEIYELEGLSQTPSREKVIKVSFGVYGGTSGETDYSRRTVSVKEMYRILSTVMKAVVDEVQGDPNIQAIVFAADKKEKEESRRKAYRVIAKQAARYFGWQYTFSNLSSENETYYIFSPDITEDQLIAIIAQTEPIYELNSKGAISVAIEVLEHLDIKSGLTEGISSNYWKKGGPTRNQNKRTSFDDIKKGTAGMAFANGFDLEGSCNE